MKIKCFYLLVTLSFLFSTELSAQEKTTWDYPVKPGMKEWAMLETGEQMFKACQIPLDVLDKLSTKELVTVCLNYPLFNDYMAFNDERKGINIMIRQFNGLLELSQQKDGVHGLIKAYADYPVISQIQKDITSEYYHIPYKLPFLELVLSDSIFLEQINSNELAELRKIAVNKYANKLQNSDVYSLFNIKKTILLAAVILNRQDKTEKLDIINTFIKNYNNPDADTLTEISKIIAL